ncbi:MAG: isoprenylcysteine carboxylmethyltransferase family protein [bacterium]|nr:isoprenylcysteine carboxylmethyltransferase family protein [bacterium]
MNIDFLSPVVTRWIFFSFMFLVQAVYWSGFRRVYGDFENTKDRARFILFGVFILALVFTGLLVNLGIFTIDDGSVVSKLLLPGCVLYLIGITGTLIAKKFLATNWSGSVTLQDGHYVVEAGLYKIVRHPIYTFSMFLYLGYTMIFPLVWMWVFYGIIALGMLRRIAEEEEFLVQNLPGYAAYRERVRYRLIPFVW